MAPLRIFKQKKESPKEKKKEEKKETAEKVVKQEISKPSKVRMIAWRVVKAPHITEKATIGEESRRYIFKIFERANKTETKKAIEEIFNVKVEKVRIINVPRKKRQRGRVRGWKGGYKKAIVTLKEGYKIEILSR